MKVQRHKDGKVYAVHGTRPIEIAGIKVGAVDYLVTHPTAGDRVWLDGYQADLVPDSTDVDVP